MTTDPFEQLRVDDEPARPDPALRRPPARPHRAPPSTSPDLPTIPLPERTPAMTDTATSPLPRRR